MSSTDFNSQKPISSSNEVNPLNQAKSESEVIAVTLGNRKITFSRRDASKICVGIFNSSTDESQLKEGMWVIRPTSEATRLKSGAQYVLVIHLRKEDLFPNKQQIVKWELKGNSLTDINKIMRDLHPDDKVLTVLQSLLSRTEILYADVPQTYTQAELSDVKINEEVAQLKPGDYCVHSGQNGGYVFTVARPYGRQAFDFDLTSTKSDDIKTEVNALLKRPIFPALSKVEQTLNHIEEFKGEIEKAEKEGVKPQSPEAIKLLKQINDEILSLQGSIRFLTTEVIDPKFDKILSDWVKTAKSEQSFLTGKKESLTKQLLGEAVPPQNSTELDLWSSQKHIGVKTEEEAKTTLKTREHGDWIIYYDKEKNENRVLQILNTVMYERGPLNRLTTLSKIEESVKMASDDEPEVKLKTLYPPEMEVELKLNPNSWCIQQEKIGEPLILWIKPSNLERSRANTPAVHRFILRSTTQDTVNEELCYLRSSPDRKLREAAKKYIFNSSCQQYVE